MFHDRSKQPISTLDWIDISQYEFLEFCSTYQEIDYNFNALTNIINTGTIKSATSNNPTTPTFDPLQHFTRSIKKDMKAFPKLKDSKQWDTWYLAVKAQARIDDLAEFLHPSYIPTSAADKLMFSLKKAFMYAVFNDVLLTDKGKSLVRKYE